MGMPARSPTRTTASPSPRRSRGRSSPRRCRPATEGETMTKGWILRIAAAAFASFFSLPVLAQAPLVQGTIGGKPVFGEGDELRLSFTCSGAPTCTGTYQATVKIPECSNTFSIAGAFSLTGLGLAAPGASQGNVFLQNFNSNDQTQANGTCIIVGSPSDGTFPFTASWNGSTGTLSMTVINDDGQPVAVPGSFTANISAPAPVFPMVVRSQIDANTATASADIQFRPQDVGQSGGVFVFASAPAPQVQGGLEAKAMQLGLSNKADTPCVLAQLNSAGQLVAVSASQLQAFVTGAFSAQGASVSILNAVPTPRVAGATFYVGYGANAGAMLDGGIFRNAVLIPGNETCPPLPYMTSLWWNPNESGWGLNLNQQGGLMFGTLFTYDASRAPLWLVMPAGTLQADGVTFTGDLYRTTGPAFNANPFTPIGPANITRVGSMTVSFSQANAGALTYTVNGIEVKKSIQRQVYGARSANCLPGTGSRTASTH